VKLLIAIPALNEEESIESIIERSLDARGHICRNSPITEVAITVVSDGSTDRTVEIASRYEGRIGLIVFPKNRGYGAAIKEAWRRSDADVLGFLDADGTCDPQFFAPLCQRLVTDEADVVLGCRLNEQSQMPLIRRLGNTIFATILTAFSSNRVKDTASGMRVVRRRSLIKLYPLPDGLHFTPAMSARSMMSDTVRIVEINMPYHERAGESKLRVLKDGLRFLRVILETAFLYRPARPLGIAGSTSLLLAAGLMIEPSVYYLQHREVLSWMIYRFLVSELCGIAGCLLLCAGFLADRIVSITLPAEVQGRERKRTLRFFRSKWFWLLPAGLTAAGVALVLSSLIERARTGGTYEHWSRYVVMTFFVSVAFVLTVTRIVESLLRMVAARLNYLQVQVLADLTEDAAIADSHGRTAAHS
jgi:glycosyltransferase involved in cell wall biosynthesis